MKRVVVLIAFGILAGFGTRIGIEWLPSLRGEGASAVPQHAEIEGSVPRTLRTSDPARAIVVLSGADVATCEDLGRQLREFQRLEVTPNGLPMDVWVYDDDPSGAVARFIGNERLAVRNIFAIDPQEALVRDGLTPAVLVVHGDGEYTGIAYRNRTKVVRAISFAELLDLDAPGRLPPMPGDGNTHGQQHITTARRLI
jgi:hypothetical protein